MTAEQTTDAGTPVVEDERVTVVVMSKDRREDLRASLPRHRARVVYVDNGSTDGSPGAVADMRPDADVVRLPQNIGSLARTVGIERATTPFVAFADDDSWWAPGALRRAADVLEANPSVAVVVARVLVGPEEREDPIVPELRHSPLDATGLPGPRILGFMACAALVRRDAVLAVGGFDPAVRFPGEEEPLALRLAAREQAIVYLDDVVVHHHPSPSRHAPAARAAAVARSAVATALLLRPWPVVRTRATAAWRTGRWRALPTARQAWSALRRRSTLPPSVEQDLALLDPDA
ncbi:glycosyltransferase family 2 protein [Cellulosimicrobium cellulans]|uniref:glycosyltransferase family 2 protein n=1 Tax=Cellulosimicrobium cellulans TaxID=1710 RepID=UPI000848EAF7|nr:glycosyltransferase [Cellulosimicrobium cellulans]